MLKEHKLLILRINKCNFVLPKKTLGRDSLNVARNKDVEGTEHDFETLVSTRPAMPK
jgi:hypothetical protein